MQSRASRQRELWRRFRKTWPGYLFISPAGLLITVFSYIAIIFSLYISFHQYDIISEARPFEGLENYTRALSDKLVRIGFRNTFIYVIVIVPSITIISLMLAVLGNQVRRGRALFRTVFFIPTITPIVVTSMLWVWLYEPTGGINRLLQMINVEGPNWLFNPKTALPAIMIMTIWGAVGYYMIIFLARGLAEIPEVFYEAAKVDGAGRWHTFWNITIPLLRNSLIFAFVTLTIAAFQVFTQVFIMTQGGPMNQTQTVQMVVYHYAFERFEMGYASGHLLAVVRRDLLLFRFAVEVVHVAGAVLIHGAYTIRPRRRGERTRQAASGCHQAQLYHLHLCAADCPRPQHDLPLHVDAGQLLQKPGPTSSPIPIRSFPMPPTLSTYYAALTIGRMGVYLGNSILYAAAVLIVQLFIDSLAAYSFARVDFPGRETLFLAVLADADAARLGYADSDISDRAWVGPDKYIHGGGAAGFCRRVRHIPVAPVLPQHPAPNWRTPPALTAPAFSAPIGASCCPWPNRPW